jgi:hypothetical protein
MINDEKMDNQHGYETGWAVPIGLGNVREMVEYDR